MHDVKTRRQAVGHDGGPYDWPHRNVVDKIQSFGELDAPDQNELLDAQPLKRFDEIDEILAGAIARLREINVPDVHLNLPFLPGAPRSALSQLA